MTNFEKYDMFFMKNDFSPMTRTKFTGTIVHQYINGRRNDKVISDIEARKHKKEGETIAQYLERLYPGVELSRIEYDLDEE